MSKKTQDNPVTQQESSEEESSAGKDSSQSQESNKSLPSSSASGQSGGFSQPPTGQGSHIQNIVRGFTVQDIVTPPKTVQSSETQSSSTSEQLAPAGPSGSRKRPHKEATAHVEGTTAKTAKKKPYKCEYCTSSIVSYQTKKDLDRHLKSTHSLTRCQNCDFLAKSLEELETHNAEQHPTAAAEPTEKDTAHVEGTPAKEAKEGSFKCEYCTDSIVSYPTKQQLDRHLKSMHSLTRCRKCNFLAKSSEELDTHNEEKHPTPAAEPTDKDTAHVKGTPAETAKEGSFKCERCTDSAVSFQTKKDLDRHLKSMHSLWRCKRCNLFAISLKELKTHIAEQHRPPAAETKQKDTAHVERTPAEKTKEGPFKCEHCTDSTSSYQTKKDLDRHLKSVHSLWRCKSCNFLAKSLEELNTHNAEQHPTSAAAAGGGSAATSSLDWGCPHCSVRFPTCLELQKHKKAHYEHNCGKCSTFYKTKKQLANHNQLFHSGEANIPFECQHCGNQFQSVKDFKIHAEDVINGKGTLKCPVCGKERKDIYHIKMHYYSLGDSHLDKFVRRKRDGNKCKKCNKKFKTERHLRKHCKYFCREKGHSCL